MKKRRSITELIDSLRGGAQESAKPEGPGTAALARLGAAFLGRLELPEGMSTEEAVAAILGMWENAGTARADKPEAGAADKAPEETPSEDEDAGEEYANELRRLPRTLHGSLSEAPEADYEGMSAEQFRRLKKQLQRASLEGRKIRI